MHTPDAYPDAHSRRTPPMHTQMHTCCAVMELTYDSGSGCFRCTSSSASGTQVMDCRQLSTGLMLKKEEDTWGMYRAVQGSQVVVYVVSD